MHRLVLGAFALALCTAADAPPDGHKHTEPAWIKRPTGDDLMGAYPRDALEQGIGGTGLVECEVALDGLLRKCVVVSENPPGSGFGAAALLVMPQIRMKPGTVDGKPVVAKVRIPINFSVDGGVSRRPQKPMTGPPRAGGVTMYVKPVWETAPTSADVARVRPRAPVEGRVVLQCPFSSTRTLRYCDIIQEEPHGKGFGAAARELSHSFRALALPGGKPAAGDLTRFAVQFDLPAANPDAAGAMVITKPEWKTLPELTDFDAVFPKAAKAAKVREGRGVLDCEVAVGGALVGCRLAGETPEGLGFGEAALKLSAHFALNPWTSDGRPVDGARIRLPIHFIDADAPAPAKP